MTTSLVRCSHFALFAILLAACGGGGTTTLNNAHGVNSIEIELTSPSIAKGTSTQLSATVLSNDNGPADVSMDLTWSSSDPSVATVSSSGKISAVGTGTATIRGTCAVASVCGSASSTVTVTVTAASLTSIALTPPAPSIAPGTSQQFTATGTFSDNSTQNLSADLTWTSSNPAVATVSSSGLVSTVGTGSTTITATCKVASVCGSLAGKTIVTVTSATLVSIAITPPAPSISLSANETFTATGTYSDNSTQNLTTQVTWTSATPAVATISNAVGTAGVAHPVTTGTTQITAALGSVTSPAVTLTVTAATLVSIAITPTGPSITVTASEQFIATGTYSDSSTQVLTTTVTWTSSTTSVATISNASNSQGLATGLQVGSSSITATLGAVTSPSVTLTVTAPTESVFWTFGSGSDGKYPPAGLVQGTDGNFYGTTGAGGTNNDGTIIMITPTGVESVLYSFAGGSDGIQPQAGLIQATDGNFYGTTNVGGATGYGAVFKITSAGVETVLYSFAGGSDGANPFAGLIQATDGNFYGTTTAGGASSAGTVFKITPAGVETVLYSFAGGSDGSDPVAGLIQATDGNFYGTTLTGGGDGVGTVFKITPAGVETVLWSFGDTASDGQSPSGTLIQGADGNFYGTTRAGGANGSVFKITPAGVETVLYSFAASGDGGSPFAGLSLGTDGNFYGTTLSGGVNLYGTLFKLTPGGIETVLYSFAGGSDGKTPLGGVIQGTDGNFYGTTELGGANSAGTIFKY